MDEMMGRLSKAKEILDQQMAELQPSNDADSLDGYSEYEQDPEPVACAEDQDQEYFGSSDDGMAYPTSKDGSEVARRPRALFDAMDSLERARGSAATPMMSPQPSREIRASIDQLHSLTLSRANQASQLQSQRAIGNNSFRSEPSNQGDSQLSRARNLSPNSNTSGSVESQNNFSGNPTQSVSSASNLMSLSQLLQNRFVELQQRVMRNNAIPRQAQDSIVADLRSISQEINDKQRRLQQEAERTKLERAQLLGQLEEARRQLQASEENRYLEREVLQRRVSEIQLKEAKSVEMLAEAEQRWKATNRDLNQQLSVQEEQLQGKRALWLTANPGSSARRDAMTAARDPFTSPTDKIISGIGANRSASNLGSSPVSKALTLKSFEGQDNKITGGPPPRVPTLRRRPHLRLDRRNEHRVTEPSHSPPFRALVIHKTPEEEIRIFQDIFSRLYGIIEGWVKSYANIPHLENDSLIARSHPVLWSYMMNCAYPGHRQDSHTHVMTLLGDERTRTWFVMRMIVQYCIREIMAIEVFLGYNSIVDEQIHEAQEKLKERGLANEARQRFVDLQCKAVNSILGSYDYSIYRSKQLGNHTKNLRDLVGPLLNNATIRTDAGRDLGVIAINAWELCVKMWTSHLSFQIYFPETNTKFNAATMAAKDRPDTDPMQLQIAQTRLKLIITPVVTLRDDRRTTIVVKNLKHAMVLTMA